MQLKIQNHQSDNRPIVYLDESGFALSMPRTHGYSKKGQRCYGRHDWGAKGRTHAIGTLIGATLLTVSLFESTINSEVFTAWVTQDLVPKLPPNSVVVMDNASFHKQTQMQDALEDGGHTLQYLPPYSPDLNPIEHKWAQVKTLRRKLGCSVDELFQTLNRDQFICI
ncbi:MAG: IS630 family transposase [Alphaproteobacteria bacterium]|nr:IS630 family transposase [Alphaproteobacteria bacterium]